MNDDFRKLIHEINTIDDISQVKKFLRGHVEGVRATALFRIIDIASGRSERNDLIHELLSLIGDDIVKNVIPMKTILINYIISDYPEWANSLLPELCEKIGINDRVFLSDKCIPFFK